MPLGDAGQGRRIRRALEVREDSRTPQPDDSGAARPWRGRMPSGPNPEAARGASTGIEFLERDTSAPVRTFDQIAQDKNLDFIIRCDEELPKTLLTDPCLRTSPRSSQINVLT